jgi:hypothetical protein
LFGGVASALPNFALSASPQVVDFGRVRPILGTASASVTITNVSADNLAGGVYGFRGDVSLPGGFNINPNPSLSTCIASGGSLSGTTVRLNHGRSCTFTVMFDPSQLPEDTYTGRLNVTIGGNTITVLTVAQVVRGISGGPNPNFALSADPGLVDFGIVKPALGTVSASVTVTNESADNLPGGRYVFLGDTNLPSGFRVNPDPGLSTCIDTGNSLSGTTRALLSHGGCTFTVQFDPSQLSEDTYEARLNVTMGGNTLRVLTVANIARGIPGGPNPNFALDASPPYVDFGRVQPALGTVSASVTISNASAASLPSGRYVFLGDVNLPSGFRVNPDPGFSNCITSGGSLSGTTRGLSSIGSCTFQVQFDPSQLPEGEYTGRLNVTMGGNTLRVLAFANVARGIPGGPNSNFALSADPSYVDFGLVKPLLGTVNQTVTVTNESADTLADGRYVFLGDVNLPAGFRVNPDPGFSTCIGGSGDGLSGDVRALLSHGSCTFQVQFNPTQLAEGEYTGRLNVTMGGNTLRVFTFANVASGIPGGPNPNFALSADPSIADFGVVLPAAGTVSLNVTVTNESADALPDGRYVFLGDVNLPAGFRVNDNPSQSTCIGSSGGSLSGDTRALLSHGSCTFQVQFDPTQLPEDTYQGRLNVTMGGNTLRLLAVANVYRGIPGGPNPNFALTATPQPVDFGRVQPVVGTVSQTVTVTNASAAALPSGRYVFLGDVNLPAGFRVNNNPSQSTCIDSGGSLSGTTRALLSHASCTFQVQFDPTQLPEDTYLGRLNVTLGGNTLRVLAVADIARGIPGGPNPNFALAANPPYANFGRVRPILGTQNLTVTIENASAEALPGGHYAFLGDVNLPAGFSVNPDPSSSTCITSGGSLSGTTQGLSSIGTCTFTVQFNPQQLPSGDYLGRLNITMGGNTLRLLAFAEVVRLVG